jgi:hypothetical protein
MSQGAADHMPVEVLERYAAGEAGAGVQDVWWAVEVHLESCAACRARLAEAVAQRSPQTSLLVEEVEERLIADVARSPRTPVRRWLPTLPSGWAMWWIAPALFPRVAMTVLVVIAAVGLDLADAASGRFPSLVLLLAPVAPLLAVAAAWSRGLDPASELVVASPRAGLDLVLRRTAAVLAVVIPALGVAGWLVGASPAVWLLPCLGFTAGALALGDVVGLHRAATGLALGWAAIVVGPSLIMARPPALLTAVSLPGWAAATAAVAIVVVLRRHGYRGLTSLR